MSDLLALVVPDLVQEQLLDGVELLGLGEEDGGETHVPAQGEAHSRAQQGGQLEQAVERHLQGAKQAN